MSKLVPQPAMEGEIRAGLYILASRPLHIARATRLSATHLVWL